MHFSKIILPFLAAVALAQDIDNDNDNDNDSVAQTPSPPEVGGGRYHAVQTMNAWLTSGSFLDDVHDSR